MIIKILAVVLAFNLIENAFPTKATNSSKDHNIIAKIDEKASCNDCRIKVASNFDDHESTSSRYEHNIVKRSSGLCKKFILCGYNEICIDEDEGKSYKCKCRDGFHRNSSKNMCFRILTDPKRRHKQYATNFAHLKEENPRFQRKAGEISKCPKGFYVFNEKCTDINECIDGSCDNSKVCTNLNGSFRCEAVECSKGYKIAFKKTCIREKKCCSYNNFCRSHPNEIFHFFIVVNSTQKNVKLVTLKDQKKRKFKNFQLSGHKNGNFELIRLSNGAQIIMKHSPPSDIVLTLEMDVLDEFLVEKERKKNIYHIYVE